MLWVRNHFWQGELLLIVNFFNLSFAYFRHPKTPRFVHIPALSGPLAWTYVALYWDGAAMVGSRHLAARILANVAVWGILVYGIFFLTAFKDYTMGYALSFLSLCKFRAPNVFLFSHPNTPFPQPREQANKFLQALAIHQIAIKTIAFQWIFAFVIFAVLFALTTAIAVPTVMGKDVSFRKNVPGLGEDSERQPLLDDQ